MSLQVHPLDTPVRSNRDLDRSLFPATAIQAKRLIDFAIATLALVLVAPLLLLLAVVVALTSPGPVVFRQSRVGRGGIPFVMFKFRTMEDGTHDRVRSDPELWTTYLANDFKLPETCVRVTRVGSLLRRTSLDELPQLINVLRGEMSIVGVRPIEMDQYITRDERSRALYGALPPGMTGLWQVEARHCAHHEARVEIDDAYVESWSLGRDLALIVRTPLAMVKHCVVS